MSKNIYLIILSVFTGLMAILTRSSEGYMEIIHYALIAITVILAAIGIYNFSKNK